MIASHSYVLNEQIEQLYKEEYIRLRSPIPKYVKRLKRNAPIDVDASGITEIYGAGKRLCPDPMLQAYNYTPVSSRNSHRFGGNRDPMSNPGACQIESVGSPAHQVSAVASGNKDPFLSPGACQIGSVRTPVGQISLRASGLAGKHMSGISLQYEGYENECMSFLDRQTSLPREASHEDVVRTQHVRQTSGKRGLKESAVQHVKGDSGNISRSSICSKSSKKIVGFDVNKDGDGKRLNGSNHSLDPAVYEYNRRRSRRKEESLSRRKEESLSRRKEESLSLENRDILKMSTCQISQSNHDGSTSEADETLSIIHDDGETCELQPLSGCGNLQDETNERTDKLAFKHVKKMCSRKNSALFGKSECLHQSPTPQSSQSKIIHSVEKHDKGKWQEPKEPCLRRSFPMLDDFQGESDKVHIMEESCGNKSRQSRHTMPNLAKRLKESGKVPARKASVSFEATQDDTTCRRKASLDHDGGEKRKKLLFRSLPICNDNEFDSKEIIAENRKLRKENVADHDDIDHLTKKTVKNFIDGEKSSAKDRTLSWIQNTSTNGEPTNEKLPVTTKPNHSHDDDSDSKYSLSSGTGISRASGIVRWRSSTVREKTLKSKRRHDRHRSKSVSDSNGQDKERKEDHKRKEACQTLSDLKPQISSKKSDTVSIKNKETVNDCKVSKSNRQTHISCHSKGSKSGTNVKVDQKTLKHSALQVHETNNKNERTCNPKLKSDGKPNATQKISEGHKRGNKPAAPRVGDPIGDRSGISELASSNSAHCQVKTSWNNNVNAINKSKRTRNCVITSSNIDTSDEVISQSSDKISTTRQRNSKRRAACAKRRTLQHESSMSDSSEDRNKNKVSRSGRQQNKDQICSSMKLRSSHSEDQLSDFQIGEASVSVVKRQDDKSSNKKHQRSTSATKNNISQRKTDGYIEKRSTVVMRRRLEKDTKNFDMDAMKDVMPLTDTRTNILDTNTTAPGRARRAASISSLFRHHPGSIWNSITSED